MYITVEVKIGNQDGMTFSNDRIVKNVTQSADRSIVILGYEV